MPEPDPLQETFRTLAVIGLRFREAAELDMTRLGAAMGGKSPAEVQAAVERVRIAQRHRRRELGWTEENP